MFLAALAALFMNAAVFASGYAGANSDKALSKTFAETSPHAQENALDGPFFVLFAFTPSKRWPEASSA